MANKQKYSMKGVLIGVSITEGKKQDGTGWKRAALSIESEGNTSKVSTFNEDDVKKANSLNGQVVNVVYTKSDDGKYKNMEKGGISQEGALDVSEETISEDSGVKLPVKGTNNFNSEGKETKTKVDPVIKEIVSDRMSKSDWANKDKRSIRGMCVSYAKDLVVSKQLELDKITDTAQKMFEYIWG